MEARRDGEELGKSVLAALAGTGQERGEGGALFGPTSGAVAAGHLIVNDAVAQVALEAVVGRLDVVVVEPVHDVVASHEALPLSMSDRPHRTRTEAYRKLPLVTAGRSPCPRGTCLTLVPGVDS